MLFNILAAWISGGKFSSVYSSLCDIPAIGGSVWKDIIFWSFIALCAIVPYLLGSINTSIVLSKILYHDDIRNHGSGNAGATNALRTYGRKFGIMTLAGDILKAIIAGIFGSALLWGHLGGAIAGLFVMIGHIFPIYYKFKGGKGVACAMSIMFILEPVTFVIVMLFYITIVLGTKYVSLASCMSVALFPVIATAIEKLYVAFTGEKLGAVPVVGVIMAAMVIFMHRANIKRLLDGKENKVSFKKKQPEVKSVPATKEEKLESRREATRAFKENRKEETKKLDDANFCTCECGRLIPVSRKKCLYCGKKNPSYKENK